MFMKVLPVLVFLGVTLLGFNALQTASLVVIPFSRRAFRRFNRWGANTWWGWCVSCARMLHETRVVLSGDDVPPRENVVLVSNHQEMADILYLLFFARMKERLGDMKWFVKDVLKYVPGVGWGMLFLDCVFVKRDWARDAASIQHTFTRIVQGQVPLWLVSFSEGTRITPAKLAAAQRYANDHGLYIPQHTLVPRPRGFVASIQGLRGHLDAVYDVTIGYVGGVPTLWQYARGLAPVAHLHVRRFPISQLPGEPDALAGWLRAVFQQKDALLERFYTTGRMGDEDSPPSSAAPLTAAPGGAPPDTPAPGP